MKNISVFILDSNAIHRNLIRHNLVRAGFDRTTSIPTLDECYYHLGKGNIPDFLIVDYLIITREPMDFLVRVGKYNSDTKIIFFTAHEDPLLAELLIENGAFDYILKSGPELRGLKELKKNLRYISANL